MEKIINKEYTSEELYNFLKIAAQVVTDSNNYLQAMDQFNIKRPDTDNLMIPRGYTINIEFKNSNASEYIKELCRKDIGNQSLIEIYIDSIEKIKNYFERHRRITGETMAALLNLLEFQKELIQLNNNSNRFT